MKKRLLSMLMAVLMIASLVPATALAVDAETCRHDNVQTVSIEKNAAAKIPGVEADVCADCGEVIDYEITPFAELRDQCIVCKNPVTTEVQAAACGQVGLTVTYCGTCGNDMGIAPKGVAALKHDLVFTVVDKPTCTEDGYTGDEVCTVCGETIKEGEVIPATGHHFKGNTCPDCGETRSTADTIRAWFQESFNNMKNFFDKIFGRN